MPYPAPCSLEGPLRRPPPLRTSWRVPGVQEASMLLEVYSIPFGPAPLPNALSTWPPGRSLSHNDVAGPHNTDHSPEVHASAPIAKTMSSHFPSRLRGGFAEQNALRTELPATRKCFVHYGQPCVDQNQGSRLVSFRHVLLHRHITNTVFTPVHKPSHTACPGNT
jgi:hypothetical protein